MIEHDAARREHYLNARSYFSISNNVLGEALAEIVVRNHSVILYEAQETASRNLALLDAFMAEHRAAFGWIRPQGGMTAFPWIIGESDARPFCRRAIEKGVLLAPGDCFGAPEHFRLGFAAIDNKFSEALIRMGDLAVS
jgi:aspartate/methionine/tyrosine aminotransferase